MVGPLLTAFCIRAGILSFWFLVRALVCIMTHLVTCKALYCFELLAFLNCLVFLFTLAPFLPVVLLTLVVTNVAAPPVLCTGWVFTQLAAIVYTSLTDVGGC